MKAIKPRVIPLLLLLCLSVGFRFSTPRDPVGLVRLSNLYLSDSLLFVSDSVQGINIYSVKNPASPVFKLNIPIQGNSGLAVKDSFIFANAYSSLLVLKVYQDSLYRVVKFIRNDFHYYRTGAVDGGMSHSGLNCGCSSPTEQQTFSDAKYVSGGVGGSYATFAVIDSFLYYLDRYDELVTMDIRTPSDPKELSRVTVSWSETLFPTRDYLFIGTSVGMAIYDRAAPDRPTLIGQISHFRSCDPVVVEDTLAYVTLRGGNRCGDPGDALLVLSIKDPVRPRILKTLAPVTPYGLTVRDSMLYVSNGYNGYTLYNAARPDSLTAVASWTEEPTKDFIWDGDRLYVMGFSDVRILDVSAPQNPAPLSVIR